MMLINEGEQSARVVALQILLNRKNKNRVVTDGTFGPLTSGAIDQVRGLLGISTGPKGIADPGLCRLLVENAGLQWIDSVDVTDPSIVGDVEVPLSKWTTPIVLGGMSSGVAHLVKQIQTRASKNKLMMLRLHGHGAPGIVAVSHGSRHLYTVEEKKNPFLDPFQAQSVISLDLMRTIKPLLEQLAPLFNNFGFVELHSCRVGLGPNGATFVQQLANVLGVPVRAALSKQDTQGIFTLTGETLTAFPNGGRLLDWAKSREESVRKEDLLMRK
jgi:peptidoglycan hydrolase-like protein with peptidoglycan-binding domain